MHATYYKADRSWDTGLRTPSAHNTLVFHGPRTNTLSKLPSVYGLNIRIPWIVYHSRIQREPRWKLFVQSSLCFKILFQIFISRSEQEWFGCWKDGCGTHLATAAWTRGSSNKKKPAWTEIVHQVQAFYFIKSLRPRWSVIRDSIASHCCPLRSPLLQPLAILLLGRRHPGGGHVSNVVLAAINLF